MSWLDEVVEDPLQDIEQHIRQLKKEEDNYHLLESLQAVMTRFEHDKRYQNDLRFVRCCLAYASFIREPEAIYQRMEDLAIGVFVAAFYEYYAEYLMEAHRSTDIPRIAHCLIFLL